MVILMMLFMVSCAEESQNNVSQGDKDLQFNSMEINFDLAQTNLQAAGYKVSVYSGRDVEPGQKRALYAVGEDIKDRVAIIEFKDEETAKLYYAATRAEVEGGLNENRAFLELYRHILETYEEDMGSEVASNYKDNIAETKYEIEESEDELKLIYLNGASVCYGSRAAINASGQNSGAK